MRSTTLLLVLVTGFLPVVASPQKIRDMVGEPKRYTVKPGDSLYRVARRHDLSGPAIAALNGIGGGRLRQGSALLLPTMHILPLEPPEGIVLNIPERAVYIFRGGRLVDRHAVAVGRPGWQTATGTYRLRSKVSDPTWHPPRSMVEKEGVKDDPVPPGPENPLGDRWMGWTAPGYGFHSTTAPRSIGRAASHGCVRLYPDAAHVMFGQVSVGIPIYSVYEPVLVGTRAGRFYLSVFDDIYSTGGTSPEAIRELLDKLGLRPLVDEKVIERIAARHDGYPAPITGASERLEVDGRPVSSAVAAILTGSGRWVVPARAVAEALGGRLEPAPDGKVNVTIGAHSLEVQAGETAATLDGQPTELPVPAVVMKGTLLLPARTLADLAGAQIQHEAGQALQITRLAAEPQPGNQGTGPQDRQ